MDELAQDMFKRTPLEAGAVVSLIGLFNAGGRFLVGIGVGLHRTTQHLHDLLRHPVLPVSSDPPLASSGNWWLFQASLFVVFHDVRRWVCDHPRVSSPTSSDRRTSAPFMVLADSLDGGGHRRAGHHYRAVEPRKGRAAARRGSRQYLRHAAAGARRAAGGWLRVDIVGATAEIERVRSSWGTGHRVKHLHCRARPGVEAAGVTGRRPYVRIPESPELRTCVGVGGVPQVIS